VGLFVAGDPIEMGALAAVLLTSKAQQQHRNIPPTIASDKTGIAHTEPAAGLSGLVHAAAAAAARAALPVLHLRSLNPYLIGTLEAPGISGTVSVPRQPRGAVAGQHAAGSISGISSFAFQVCIEMWLLQHNSC
jgi:acyl transferase domain-containing protein